MSRPAHAAEKDSAYPSLELFSYVMEKVRNDYVDGKKLTYQELVYGALKGMINTLDPHSEFMEPAKYDELQKDTEGKFGGLGIMIEIEGQFCDGAGADGGHAGFAGGHPGGRPHHQDRRQERGQAGPAGGGGPVARRPGHGRDHHHSAALDRAGEGLRR